MACEQFIEKNFSPASMDLIKKAQQILATYAAQGYDLSLRQVYYQFVARNWLPNTERSYKNLGNVVSDARLAGLLDWNMIRDRGRAMVQNGHWSSPSEIIKICSQTFRFDLWENQPCYVEVMVEKQALEGVLVPVCRELDVPFTANKGYSSSSAVYEASKRFLAAAQEGKDLFVLYLGDHDPSGIDMTRDVDDRLHLFLRHYGIEVERLALNMDQVQQYNPPENPAKLSDSRADGYIAQYGDSSWELDALEPTVLASLVRQAVFNIRDESLWEEAVARQQEARAKLKALSAAWGSAQLDELLGIDTYGDDDYSD